MNNQSVHPFRFISINGKIFTQEKAVITAVNRSMFGEGIFTTIKVKQGIPLFWDKHRERLQTQTQQLGFAQIPLSLSLDDVVQKLIKKNSIPDCVLKVTIINGTPPLVIGNSRALPPETDTIKVITVPETRDTMRIYKTINRLVNEQAHLAAEKQGAQDAVFIDKKNLIEATISNVFSINRKGALITPSMEGRGLQGIVRRVIMEQAPVIEEDIPATTDGPLVLVNSLRVRKVTHLNKKTLTDGEDLFQKINALVKKAEKNYLQISNV